MSGSYFDRLEAELRGAVPRADPRAAGSWRVRHGWRRGVGGFALALSLAVVITIVAIFLAAGPRGHQPAPAHRPAFHHRGVAPGEFIYPLGAVPTLRQLRDNFAVLRRPQTAADRSWRPQCNCAGAARQLNGLTRLVATLPGGYRVFLDVEQLTVGGQLNMAAGSYVLNLDIVNRNGNSTSEAFGPNVGYAVSPLNSGGGRALRGHSKGSQVFASVVPDGVSTVAWTFGCPRLTTSNTHCEGVHSPTLTVQVANNVAARVISGVGNCGPCAVLWWSSSSGKVVASFPEGVGNLPAPPFVVGGRGSRTLPILLPDGIGDARIGEPSSTAVRNITKLLGQPTDAHVKTGGCGIDHESVWTSPSVADPLTTFERDGRFAGYQYGAPVSEIGLQRGPGAVLKATRGLTLDETVGDARRLYPTGFATGAMRGVGRWQAAGAGGTFHGFVLPATFPLRGVTDNDAVASIDAGQTGCPPSGTQ